MKYFDGAWRNEWQPTPEFFFLGGGVGLTGIFYFIFNLFIYSNWRLITLQYCGGFCHTFT